jgi:hypothetical protein
VTDQERMEEIFSDSFHSIIGTARAREHTLTLEYLGMQQIDLQGIEAIFTEEEVWSVIKELHPDRAPGPDGYIGAFFQKAWGIIKNDIMAALIKLFMGMDEDSLN